MKKIYSETNGYFISGFNCTLFRISLAYGAIRLVAASDKVLRAAREGGVDGSASAAPQLRVDGHPRALGAVFARDLGRYSVLS